MEDTSTCSNTGIVPPILDSDSLSETSSIVPIVKEIKIYSEILRDVDMQTNSRNEISGISSLLNLGDDNEVVSLSDLNLIDPARLDQVAEDCPKLLNKEKKPRNKRRSACRSLTSTQIIDSETDTQDFSPSDGSDFDPESASRFSDDSMNLVYLSDVKNHPDNVKFWKKSLLERPGSKLDTDNFFVL